MQPGGHKTSLKNSVKLLYWEGAFAVAYETICISATYLSGFAGEQGVPLELVTWLHSLPWLGAVGQLGGLFALYHAKNIKHYTLWVAFMARMFWLFPLLFGGYLLSSAQDAGVRFDAQSWFWLVLVVTFLSTLFAASSGIAWNSWMKTLIPESIQGRFFGVRYRAVTTAVIITHFVGAMIVNWKVAELPMGYAVLFIIGWLAAMLSSFLLARVGEGRNMVRSTPTLKNLSFQESLALPWKSAAFRRVLLIAALFNGSIQFAGPYFPYYFTKDLSIPMKTVAFWGVFASFGSIIAAAFWGKVIDRVGNPAKQMRFTAFFIAISPIFYITHNTYWMRIYAPFEFFLNGFMWSGYFVAFSSLLFKVCPREKNVFYFSLYTAFSGVCGGVGAFMGGKLAQWLAPWGGFSALWILATAVRLFCVFVLFAYLPQFKRPGDVTALPFLGQRFRRI